MKAQRQIIDDTSRSAESKGMYYEDFVNLIREEEYTTRLKNYLISTPTIIEGSLKTQSKER